MKNSIVAGVMLACLPFAVIAADCDVPAQRKAQEVRTSYKQLKTLLIKLETRREGQLRREKQIGSDLLADIPILSPAPELLHQFFDGGGKNPIFVCNAEGIASEELDHAADAVQSALVVANKYEKSLGIRETAIRGIQNAQVAATEEAKPFDSPAPVSGGTTEFGPLPHPDNPNLYRRVIVLPDNEFRKTPEFDSDARTLPTFSVHYVFDETFASGAEWLEIGENANEGPQGWILIEHTQDWSTMLVMEFAPVGKRRPVLFFKERRDLVDLVESFSLKANATDIYRSIELERQRLAQEPQYGPEWDSRLAAIEPIVAVDTQERPYVLPILGWAKAIFDDGIRTNLLKVAAIPAKSYERSTSDTGSLRGDNETTTKLSGGLSAGIVFVMDTTISMQPYINRTYEAVKAFYDVFGSTELAHGVAFGLIAYRDNNAQDYVIRLYQVPDIEADSREVLDNINRVEEAGVPTKEFREDGLSALAMTIDNIEWDDFDLRLIVFVTDASSREGNDEKMARPGETVRNIRGAALDKKIVILPIHLLTPANKKNRDREIAKEQYYELGKTGDINLSESKYTALDAMDDRSFASNIRDVAEQLAGDFYQLATKGAIERDELDIELVDPRPISGAANEGRLAKLVAGEIFRAYLESLGRETGQDVPTFLSAWASDRDLVDPNRRTLQVKVFLTRNQLNTLAESLDFIVRSFRDGGDDPKKFFENLQLLAAKTSSDPESVRYSANAAVREIMPNFLRNLPYKSEILQLSEEFWLDMSVSKRQEYVEILESRQVSYQRIYEQTSNWLDFGTNEPGREVYPMALDELP